MKKSFYAKNKTDLGPDFHAEFLAGLIFPGWKFH